MWDHFLQRPWLRSDHSFGWEVVLTSYRLRKYLVQIVSREINSKYHNIIIPLIIWWQNDFSCCHLHNFCVFYVLFIPQQVFAIWCNSDSKKIPRWEWPAEMEKCSSFFGTFSYYWCYGFHKVSTHVYHLRCIQTLSLCIGQRLPILVFHSNFARCEYLYAQCRKPRKRLAAVDVCRYKTMEVWTLH